MEEVLCSQHTQTQTERQRGLGFCVNCCFDVTGVFQQHLPNSVIMFVSIPFFHFTSLQSFSLTAWDLSMWAPVMMSLWIMQPKLNSPGSASQRATRRMPSSDIHRPRLMPRAQKMASCSSRTVFSVWLVISSLLYSSSRRFLCSSWVAKEVLLNLTPSDKIYDKHVTLPLLYNLRTFFLPSGFRAVLACFTCQSTARQSAKSKSAKKQSKLYAGLKTGVSFNC